MSRGLLTIDLAAIVANWRALNALSHGETAAVIKANAYGLDARVVGPALAKAGARTFFVAVVDEGVALRAALGDGPRIFVFGGMMPGDIGLMRDNALIPLLNSAGQVRTAQEFGGPVGIQLDSGMNRLGMEAAEMQTAAELIAALDVQLVMSHLACADEPDHAQNSEQLAAFTAMTAHPVFTDTPRSLAATGGTLLGADYHFDLTRPGIGLYGGLPFADAAPVVTLETPIIQIRDVMPGEAVGYGAAYVAKTPRRIATVNGGYADGLLRAISAGFTVSLDDHIIPSVGRVSMDLITLDVTDLPNAAEGDMVQFLGPHQTVDQLADAAGTIGYEILTSLGPRYERRYTGQVS
ncbi:MAG: alanine racemase [Pikeienuella sp.]